MTDFFSHLECFISISVLEESQTEFPLKFNSFLPVVLPIPVNGHLSFPVTLDKKYLVLLFSYILLCPVTLDKKVFCTSANPNTFTIKMYLEFDPVLPPSPPWTIISDLCYCSSHLPLISFLLLLPFYILQFSIQQLY